MAVRELDTQHLVRAPRGMGDFRRALHDTFPEAQLRGRPTGSKNRGPRKARHILTPAEAVQPENDGGTGNNQ